MSKKEKNEGPKAAAIGGALGASAGIGAGATPIKPQPKPEPDNKIDQEPVKPEKPEPTPQRLKPEEDVDVLTDPSNPIDIEVIVDEVSHIAPVLPEDIIIEPNMYGGPPAGPEDPYDPYTFDPNNPDPFACVYAGPMDPMYDIDPTDDGIDDDDIIGIDFPDE